MAGCTVAFYFFLDIERERYNTLQANPICQKTSLWGSGRPKSALCISTVLSFIPFPSLSSLFLFIYLFLYFSIFTSHSYREVRGKKIKNKKANTTNSYSHIARWAFYLPLAICFFCLLSQSHTHKNKHRQNTLHTLSLSVGWFFQSLPFKNSRDWCLR